MSGRIVFFLLVMASFSISAYAQEYVAKVTVNSGNSFLVKSLNIQGERLYQDGGTSWTSVSMIKGIEFRFSGISLPMCERMFESGDRKALEDLLQLNVGPLAMHAGLPTNLGDYFIWLMKAQYWNRNESGMARTIGQIRATGNPEHVSVASMYFTMLLLDQSKLDNARTVFDSVANPEEISVPMTEYLKARFAMQEGDARKAMQHVARIVAFYGRDPEWMAPATVLEAKAYQMLGLPEKAATVAEELILAYPGTQWSSQGEAIKMESNGTSGG